MPDHTHTGVWRSRYEPEGTWDELSSARPTGVAGRVTDSTAGPHQIGQGSLPDGVEQLVRGTRGAEGLAASLTGQRPRTRLLHQYQLLHVDDPGLTLLQTPGPVLGRDLELVKPGQGEPVVVATSTELVAPGRLPQAVAEDLRQRQESLDQLLNEHGVDWDSQLIGAVAVWASAPAVQVLRRIWLDCLVGALVSEEHLLVGDQLTAAGPPEPVA